MKLKALPSTFDPFTKSNERKHRHHHHISLAAARGTSSNSRRSSAFTPGFLVRLGVEGWWEEEEEGLDGFSCVAAAYKSATVTRKQQQEARPRQELKQVCNMSAMPYA